MASLYCVSAVRTAPLRRRASGVIQPPVAWPASVGCSNARRAPHSAHSKCFTTVNQGLLSMPMTFHVSSLVCVFMALSHARHATFSALSRSAVGTVMVQWHQAQYLAVAGPRDRGVDAQLVDDVVGLEPPALSLGLLGRHVHGQHAVVLEVVVVVRARVAHADL